MAEPCCQPPPAENASGKCPGDVALDALLQDVLACLRRRRDTPLQEDDDEGLPISPAVFQALVSKHFSQAGRPPVSAAGLPAALDRLVEESLEEGPPSTTGDGACTPLAAAVSVAPAGPETGPEVEAALHAWIESLCLVLREVHPRAIEILALKRGGFDERDVSERLALPLRLKRRIMGDLRAAWQRRRS